MGCNTSRSDGDVARTISSRPVSTKNVSTVIVNEPLLLRLVSASNLPAMDLTSESDVYCNASLMPKGGKARAKAKWPVRWDSSDPLWDSCRLLGSVIPAETDKLVLQFMDCDDASPGAILDSDDVIGTATCSMASLPIGERVALPIVLTSSAKRQARKDAGAPSCVVVRESALSVPKRKSVYIVRHGESVWNKAQKDVNVAAMLSDVDHPLNEAGREQAERLRDAIEQAAAGSGPAADEAKALQGAAVIMASPLTRAVQTCLIGLQPVLLPAGGAARPVLLNPNMREKRNFGGKDSSGKWCGEALLCGVNPNPTLPLTTTLTQPKPQRCGEALLSGVREEIGKLYAGMPEVGAALATIPLELTHVQVSAFGRHRLPSLLAIWNCSSSHPRVVLVGLPIAEIAVDCGLLMAVRSRTHVQNKWWLGSKESEAHVADRIGELLAQVRGPSRSPSSISSFTRAWGPSGGRAGRSRLIERIWVVSPSAPACAAPHPMSMPDCAGSRLRRRPMAGALLPGDLACARRPLALLSRDGAPPPSSRSFGCQIRRDCHRSLLGTRFRASTAGAPFLRRGLRRARRRRHAHRRERPRRQEAEQRGPRAL